MPTFNEISKDYASKIDAAIKTDGFTKTASINEEVVKFSATAKVLKGIASDLKDKWQVDNKPLSKEQEEQILRGIAEELGLPRLEPLHKAVKASSNDAYMELVTDINDIIRNKK